MGIREGLSAPQEPSHGLYVAVPLAFDPTLVRSMRKASNGVAQAVAPEEHHASLLFASDAAVPISEFSRKDMTALRNKIVNSFSISGAVGEVVIFANPTIGLIRNGIGMFATSPQVISDLRSRAADLITDHTGIAVNDPVDDKVHVKLYNRPSSDTSFNWQLGDGPVEARIGQPVIVKPNNVGPREAHNRQAIHKKPTKYLSRRAFF